MLAGVFDLTNQSPQAFCHRIDGPAQFADFIAGGHIDRFDRQITGGYFLDMLQYFMNRPDNMPGDQHREASADCNGGQCDHRHHHN